MPSGVLSEPIRARLWIGGEWVTTDREEPVLEKFTGRPFATMPVADAATVAQAVGAAKEAFVSRPLTPSQRHRLLRAVSEAIRRDAETLALTIAREGGKPLRDARVEVARAATTFELSAEEARRIGGEVVPIAGAEGAENRMAFTVRMPVGVVAAISPFNFPLNLVAHKVGPAIAAGNTVVLKPSPLTPITAYLLCRLLAEAGAPPGLVNLVHGDTDVGEALTQDPRVDFFSFTGSPAVGARIKAAAGLRRTLLELGSNSANIVHEDADLATAAELLSRRAFANAGQVCISPQRLLVHRKVAEPFLDAFLTVTRGLKVGDPTDPETDIGPMISEEAARRAMAWIEEAVAAGAELLLAPRREGAVLTPAVLTRVRPEMKVVCEEAFAPLVTVQTYETVDEAIALANDSKYGLQAGVFTRDLGVAMRFVNGLVVGGVIVNDTSSYRADLMPYGGVKMSGNGREGPRYAVEEMTELKTVVLNL
jgi:acyl-CoA reductase-like NAD-dependent aldehyde dehydrogenase